MQSFRWGNKARIFTKRFPMSSLFSVPHCNYSLGSRATDTASWMRKAPGIDVERRGNGDSRPAPVASAGNNEGLADPPTSHAEMTLLAAVWSWGGWREEGPRRSSGRMVLVSRLSVCNQLTNWDVECA